MKTSFKVKSQMAAFSAFLLLSNSSMSNAGIVDLLRGEQTPAPQRVAFVGAARVQQYCRDLCGDVIAEARELGFTVEPDEGRGAHLFGLRVPAGLDLRALHVALQSRGVFASLRGSALRVSPNVYNDVRDATALRTALQAATSGGKIAVHP